MFRRSAVLADLYLYNNQHFYEILFYWIIIHSFERII